MPERTAQPNLHSLINLWEVLEDGTVLGTSGEAGFLYRLKPRQDASLMDEAVSAAHMAAVGQLLSVLQPGSALSFFVDVRLAESAHAAALSARLGRASGAVEEILQSKLDRQGAKRRKAEAHLLLAVHPSDFLKIPLMARTFFPWPNPGEEARRKGDLLLEKLAGTEALVLSQASRLGTVIRLKRDDVLRFYWRSFNPAKAEAQIAPPQFKSFFTLRSQLAFSPMREEKDAVWVDGFYHRGISLYTFGEHLELGGAEALVAKLPEGSRLAFHFMAVDLEAALDRAKGLARRSSGLAFLQGAKNYEAVARASELDELVSLVRAKGERLFVASACLLVRDRDRQVLDRKAMEALMLMRDCLGAEGLAEDLQHRRMFLSSLPLGAVAAPRRHTLTGEASACLAPLSAPWRGSQGLGILFGTREGDALSLDLFEGDTPRHGIVVGSTGSGKSFTMNYIVLSLFVQDPNARFVVLDIGGSYRRLCDLLGGTYFEVNLSKDFALNPFPDRQAMLDGKGDFDADLLGYLALLLERMLGKEASQNQRRIMESTLRGLYAPPGAAEPMGKIQARSPAAGGAAEPLLGDFLGLLKGFDGPERDRAEASEMARELALFAEGSYGAIFNTRRAGVKPFEGRLSVFDLARLKEHPKLQGILITIIGFGLAGSMSRKDIRKVIVLDEGWEFFNDPSASELVSRLYRTARKFNGLVISVSQSPRDFLKSEASTAMLANSYWKAFLRLDMGHEELSGFGLNARQVEAAKSLTIKKKAYSELLMVFGDRSRVLRLEPGALEYWIATTNAEECARELELAREKPGLSRLALLNELAQREPCASAQDCER